MPRPGRRAEGGATHRLAAHGTQGGCDAAVERLALSARAARRVLKVGRTIADLAEERRTGPEAVAEALGYRDELAPSG